VLHDKAPECVGHRHHLENADAPDVAGLRAVAAAFGVPQRDLALLRVACEVHLLDDLGERRVGLLALRAQRAHEPLRENADDGRGEQVILDAHVEKPVDRRWRVVGMHG